MKIHLFTLLVSAVLMSPCYASDDKTFVEDVFIETIIQQDTVSFNNRFAYHLEELIDPSIKYIPEYIHVDYPCGDVPADIGVCSDVVVRAFKKVDVCLQQEVHEYRKANGLTLDKNIDHRRVRNLGPYFASLGWELQYDPEVTDFFEPGDIIWWKLGGKTDHIGIVMPNGMVLHNIGNGQVVDVNPTTYQVYKVYRIKE